MWSLTRLRNHPHFAPLFAHVHPLCWLILWWQLNRLIRWFHATNPEDVLFQTSVWGIVTICYVAEREDPRRYRPLERTFRPLTDPSWESALPQNIEAKSTFILPGEGGEVAPKGSEGALPSPVYNST